ncbi:DUF2306 domain-containing protein [Micromonospora sp. WMMD882]|uniref:DUF2306 domain-containing protein n=1 Tax=Micromonospora sp. WMMD882 TaxID=3015151 RepID=UPI00248C197A|nr:DUF2306 domain-containing protein [Micromonospora sp. WMMD882]WBB78695.1 DUF2306 domain-containing protein [Micromonospora sp. WMMD882]
MTHSPLTEASAEQEPAEPVGRDAPASGDTPPRRSWWRRPWFLPGAILAYLFIFMFVPPYLTLDPAQARLPNLRHDIPWHYGFLVAHVISGTVAMATVPFQVWPAFRRRFPALHRYMGRVYIVVGVIPSTIAALAIVPFAMGPAGNVIGGLLWLGTSLWGWRMARQRRFEEHRRFMIYSFALCLQIIEGRVMVLTIPHLPGWDPSSFPLLLETASWIGIVLNLLIAQWYLEWSARRGRTGLERKRTGLVVR